jgi:hypothetical protein
LYNKMGHRCPKDERSEEGSPQAPPEAQKISCCAGPT